MAIDRYLRKDPDRRYPWRVRSRSPVPHDPAAEPLEHPVYRADRREVEERRASFVEVQAGMTREAAVTEARRCLRCDYRLEGDA